MSIPLFHTAAQMDDSMYPGTEVYRILVVDDDAVDRLAVQRALKRAGIDIESLEAETCEEAIAQASAYALDCIFLDYRLPDQDGLRLVQALRQQGVKSPLVVLTGQGDEEIAVELMKAGATDYLSKSRVTPEVLSRVLRNAVRVYRAEQKVELANQQLRTSNELLLKKNQELEWQRQQIQLQNLKLLEASRLKSQFLATMSHELRTPMNAIIGFSQMLLRPNKGQLSDQQRDMVERILNNGKNLLTMLNEILDFSKIEAGRLDLTVDSFNLHHLVSATVEEMRSLAEQKHLHLDVQANLDNPTVVNDAARVRQVLVNLLSNAIKFTETGRVSVMLDEPNPDQVRLSVQDTGIGIATEHLESIFEAFRQIDQTMTRRYTGTGLGLAITDSLVSMMQGHISVESTLGQGTLFQVYVPRQVASVKASIAPVMERSPDRDSLQVS